MFIYFGESTPLYHNASGGYIGELAVVMDKNKKIVSQREVMNGVRTTKFSSLLAVVDDFLEKNDEKNVCIYLSDLGLVECIRFLIKFKELPERRLLIKYGYTPFNLDNIGTPDDYYLINILTKLNKRQIKVCYGDIKDNDLFWYEDKI